MIYEGKGVDYVSGKLASDGTLASTDSERSEERKNRLLGRESWARIRSSYLADEQEDQNGIIPVS